jgi:hypothetical protein
VAPQHESDDVGHVGSRSVLRQQHESDDGGFAYKSESSVEAVKAGSGKRVGLRSDAASTAGAGDDSNTDSIDPITEAKTEASMASLLRKQAAGGVRGQTERVVVEPDGSARDDEGNDQERGPPERSEQENNNGNKDERSEQENNHKDERSRSEQENNNNNNNNIGEGSEQREKSSLQEIRERDLLRETKQAQVDTGSDSNTSNGDSNTSRISGKQDSERSSGKQGADRQGADRYGLGVATNLYAKCDYI